MIYRNIHMRYGTRPVIPTPFTTCRGLRLHIDVPPLDAPDLGSSANNEISHCAVLSIETRKGTVPCIFAWQAHSPCKALAVSLDLPPSLSLCVCVCFCLPVTEASHGNACSESTAHQCASDRLRTVRLDCPAAAFTCSGFTATRS